MEGTGLSVATTITSISPDNPNEAIKPILAIIVEHAGHSRHRSTLAVRLDEHFGTDAILRRLADCEKKFEDHS